MEKDTFKIEQYTEKNYKLLEQMGGAISYNYE